MIENYLNKRFFMHILFWLFYVLFFGLIYGKYGNDYKWYFIESICMLPFIMTATYVTIYAILPFYLKRRKLVLSVFLIVVLLFSITLGERIFLRILNGLPISFDTIFGVTFLYLLLETNFMVAIAFAVKILKKWVEQQKEKHELDRKNLESELKMLKAQLHPHFLFNTMNNLYALSLEKSSKTSEGIAKISSLLRSVLYECNEAEIELNKEISLIENFIDLEKLRYGNRLKIDFYISGNTTDKKIPPMLLFTFIENCFKHGSRNDSGNPVIKINLESTADKIIFETENSVTIQNTIQDEKEGGIGLKNVQKRLDILYTNNYDLKIFREKSNFKVRLVINSNNE